MSRKNQQVLGQPPQRLLIMSSNTQIDWKRIGQELIHKHPIPILEFGLVMLYKLEFSKDEIWMVSVTLFDPIIEQSSTLKNRATTVK